MSRLSLFLLGPFQAMLDREHVSGFASHKVRALLAYLAVEAHRPHHRDALAGLFWPAYPDRAARDSLRNALANLRKAIGDRPAIGDRDATPPYLFITRETVQFNAASDHWLDVAAFGALAGPGGEDAPAVQQLEGALALYRGPFLEGLSVGDSPEFEDWALLVRERLQRQVLVALQRLAEHYEKRGAYERACEAARRQVELEPWQEESHRRLMHLLALSGQRCAALAQYVTCCRLLRAELDVEPTVETTRLYERIRDGETKEAASRSTRQHNLPAQLIPFVGRKVELAAIAERLRDPTCRLLTLIGPGGSGKTRLALEAAKAFLSEGESALFDDGLYFVSLAPLQSVEAIVPAVAQALGFSFYAAPEGSAVDPGQQLLDYLRQKRMLLLLDNMEHLLDGVETIVELLETAPEVKTLVTSRARLNVGGEQLFPVRGLDVPPLPSLEDGREAGGEGQYGAVHLFLSSAQRVRPGYEPTGEDLVHVADICRLLEGMPLAILLAAAWVETLSPAEIAAQLRGQGVDFLAADWRDVPVRQRSMRAVFDRSWSLLSERERAIFAGLSVFRGGFTWTAAQQVVGASLRELKALVDLSMLHYTPVPATVDTRAAPFDTPGEHQRAEGRYEVHELLRQYAAEKLGLATERGEAVRDRHCAYYAGALEEWEGELKGPGQQAAFAEIRADVENARAAWEWAMERGQVQRLAQAVDGLCRYYEWEGRFQEGESACREAAERLERAQKSPNRTQALARILTWQSAFARILGRTERAGRLQGEALALLEESGAGDRAPAMDAPKEPALSAQKDTRPERAFLLLEMGRVADNLGDREKARRHYVQSEALYRALDDRWGRAYALCDLGQVVKNLGSLEEAKWLLGESLSIRRSLGDRRGTSDSLVELGALSVQSGDYADAEQLVREAIAIRDQIGDRSGAAHGRFVLACTFAYLGRFAEACALLEGSAAIQQELGNRVQFLWANAILSWARTNLGLYEQARTLEQANLAGWREIGLKRGIGLSLLGLGSIALARKAHAEARPLLAEGLTVLRQVGQRHEESLALACLGHLEYKQGHQARARRRFYEALHIAAEIEVLEPAITSLALFAPFLADQGRLERAVELYALAARDPYVGHSRLWEDVAGRHLTAAAAATLPPEAVAAAQERGRARDLWATVEELLAELGRSDSSSR